MPEPNYRIITVRSCWEFGATRGLPRDNIENCELNFRKGWKADIRLLLITGSDPNVWSGRASQEVFVDPVAVRSCINVFGLSLERDVLRAIMDISARAISLADRPRTGHSGHQCSHAPGRPILHLVSSSRRPRQETGCGATSLRAPCLCSSIVRAVRPFLRPDLRLSRGAAHRGRQGRPACLARLWRRRFQAMP